MKLPFVKQSMQLLALLLTLLSIVVRRTDCRKKSSHELEKYVAASTEDLARLFQLEKELWGILKKYQTQEGSKKDAAAIKTFLSQTHFDDFCSENSLEHVSHPVNSFHAIKRTTGLWEEIIMKMEKQSKLKKAKQILRKFPERSDFEEGAAFGLMTIQLYYDISYDRMMSGKTRKSEDDNSLSPQPLPLSWRDAVTISRIAQHVGRLDKQIEWLRTALEYCDENDALIVRELERAVMEHDKVLLEHGLGHITDKTPDGLPEVPVFTFSHPVGDAKTSEAFEKSVQSLKKEAKLIKIGKNIKTLENPTETKFLTRTFHRMWYYGQNTTIGLCQGKSMMNPDVEKKLTCHNLHYHNPYLSLGPFKYEVLSKDPHVGIFRDFYSMRETDGFLSRARGDIRSTGYQVGDRVRYYTTQRISKRVTVGEEDFHLARRSSERISLATRWIVHQDEEASDDYNIINYGIGGQIEVHVDYWNADNKRAGGARTSTFLGYLSSVGDGGRTVFPGLGLSVQPERGSALFWVTVRTDEEYDSRMYHMGCPVREGNKWVATKWIYSDSQMWNHPCQRVEGNYRTFRN